MLGHHRRAEEGEGDQEHEAHHLDGKWLLRTSDITLTPDDLAAAHKQLLQVEHG